VCGSYRRAVLSVSRKNATSDSARATSSSSDSLKTMHASRARPIQPQYRQGPRHGFPHRWLRGARSRIMAPFTASPDPLKEAYDRKSLCDAIGIPRPQNQPAVPFGGPPTDATAACTEQKRGAVPLRSNSAIRSSANPFPKHRDQSATARSRTEWRALRAVNATGVKGLRLYSSAVAENAPNVASSSSSRSPGRQRSAGLSRILSARRELSDLRLCHYGTKAA